MEQKAKKTTRKPRADSLRNRERLLQAAKEVFGTGGAQASLEAVAKCAGVGIGTLYRHFPTRDALFEAVYRREIEQLVELAEELGRTKPPVEALRRWIHAYVEVIATKKGMLATLALAAEGRSELYAYSAEQVKCAATALLDRAIKTGAIRGDISTDELLRAMLGLLSTYYMQNMPGWQDTVLRLVDVFIDGLRRNPEAGPQSD